MTQCKNWTTYYPRRLQWYTNGTGYTSVSAYINFTQSSESSTPAVVGKEISGRMKTFVVSINGAIAANRIQQGWTLLRALTVNPFIAPQALLAIAEYCCANDAIINEAMEFFLGLINQDVTQANFITIEACLLGVKTVTGRVLRDGIFIYKR